MATTTSPTAATATVTVTATAIPYYQPQGSNRAGPVVSYGFIVLIIILGILLLLSLGCVGHGFLARRRARRRGEDPGPIFGTWWWQTGPPPGQAQAHGLQPIYGAGIHVDDRGREFYSVAGATTVGVAGLRTAGEQDLKGGGEVGMARYA